MAWEHQNEPEMVLEVAHGPIELNSRNQVQNSIDTGAECSRFQNQVHLVLE